MEMRNASTPKIDAHFRVSKEIIDIAEFAKDFELCNTKSSLLRFATETSMLGIYNPWVVHHQLRTIRMLFETTSFSGLTARYFSNTDNSELVDFFKGFRDLLNSLPTFWYKLITARLDQSQEYQVAERISWRVEQFGIKQFSIEEEYI